LPPAVSDRKLLVDLAKGRYDNLTIWEAPNDDAMSQFALAIGSLGNIATESLRAHTEEEFKTLLVGLR
jgi:uncharacterized protein with GYD domain